MKKKLNIVLLTNNGIVAKAPPAWATNTGGVECHLQLEETQE